MKFIHKIWNTYKKPLDTLNTIYIDRKALLHNYDYLSGTSENIEVFPTLKANAYGHGIEQVARILQERKPSYIVVDSYYEGLTVQDISPGQRILCIGHNIHSNLDKLDYSWFTPSILHIDTLEKLGELKKQIRVHIKVNTGIHRQGMQPEQIDTVVEILKKYPQIEVEGIFSHFSESEVLGSTYTQEQIDIFKKSVEKFKEAGIEPKYIHLNNSGGTLNRLSDISNSCRCGISLYGIHPANKTDSELHEVLKFVTKLTHKHTLKKGESVGYNCTYTAREDMTIGTIPVGYHEGISRNMSNTGYFLYEGKKLPIIGRISMNLITLDLRNAPDIQLEDEITLLGQGGVGVYKIAEWQNTIPYEVLTNLDGSIRRSISNYGQISR